MDQSSLEFILILTTKSKLNYTKDQTLYSQNIYCKVSRESSTFFALKCEMIILFLVVRDLLKLNAVNKYLSVKRESSVKVIAVNWDFMAVTHNRELITFLIFAKSDLGLVKHEQTHHSFVMKFL